MRRALLALLAAAAVGKTLAATDIDKDGFTQDGKTTYCQQVTTETAPFEFFSMHRWSVGKCPVVVELQATATPGSKSVDIAWSASAAPNVTEDVLFSSVIDQTTQRPKDIRATALLVCPVGTNCKENTIVPTVVGESNLADAGPFDDTGKKTLSRYTFEAPPSGNYIIAGKVQVLSEGGVVDFVVFQRVSFGPASTEASDVQQPALRSAVSTADAPGTVKAADPSLQDMEMRDSQSGALSSSGATKKSSSGLNVLVASLAGCGFLMAVVYLAAMKRDKNNRERPIPPVPMPTDETLRELGITYSMGVDSSRSEDLYINTNRTSQSSYGGLHDSCVELPLRSTVGRAVSTVEETSFESDDVITSMETKAGSDRGKGKPEENLTESFWRHADRDSEVTRTQREAAARPTRGLVRVKSSNMDGSVWL